MLGQLVKVKNSQYFMGLTIPPLSNIGIVTRTHNSKNASPDVTVLIFYKPSAAQIRFTEIPVYVKDLEILSTEPIMFEDVFKNKINLDDLVKKLDIINPFEAYQEKYEVDDLNDSNTIVDSEELRLELVKALMTIRIYKKIFNDIFIKNETADNEENNNPKPAVANNVSKGFRELIPEYKTTSKRSPRVKPSDVLNEVLDMLDQQQTLKEEDVQPIIDNSYKELKELNTHFWQTYGTGGIVDNGTIDIVKTTTNTSKEPINKKTDESA